MATEISKEEYEDAVAKLEDMLPQTDDYEPVPYTRPAEIRHCAETILAYERRH